MAMKSESRVLLSRFIRHRNKGSTPFFIKDFFNSSHLDVAIASTTSRGIFAEASGMHARTSKPPAIWYGNLPQKGKFDCKLLGSSPKSAWNADFKRRFQVTPGSNISKRKFMIDTLALVRRLEGQGLSPQQAEGITSLVTKIMAESMEDINSNFITKQEMQMTEVIAETTLSKFKNEMKSTQEQNYDNLRRETERLRTEIERLRSELKYEMDKITAGQRLDMNLEKGRMREELQQQIQETSNLENRLDKEVNALKAEMEAAKFEVIKYCVGTLVSVSAVGLGILRILM